LTDGSSLLPGKTTGKRVKLGKISLFDRKSAKYTHSHLYCILSIEIRWAGFERQQCRKCVKMRLRLRQLADIAFQKYNSILNGDKKARKKMEGKNISRMGKAKELGRL